MFMFNATFSCSYKIKRVGREKYYSLTIKRPSKLENWRMFIDGAFYDQQLHRHDFKKLCSRMV